MRAARASIGYGITGALAGGTLHRIMVAETAKLVAATAIAVSTAFVLTLAAALGQEKRTDGALRAAALSRGKSFV